MTTSFRAFSNTSASRALRRPVWALALAVLAALATTPAHPATASACGAEPSPEDALRRLNEARARGAVCRRAGALAMAEPLQWSDSLAAVAAAQAQDMAELDQMSHRDRQDRGLPERLAVMGYRFSAAAENVAVGYSSIDAVVQAWLGSESHCDNMMNAKVRELGLACVDARAAGRPGEGRYWALILGAQRRAR